MKKEYFTIPNLLGYLRILLLPVFLYLYYHAETLEDYIVAFTVLVISMLTDAFDGMIARKFNQVTDFGKALDPVADKLTQGSLAIAVTFRYPQIIPFLILFIIKEFYMGIMGLYLIKRKNFWTPAQWFGKVCTIILDIGIGVLLLYPNFDSTVVTIMVVVMSALLLFSFVKYVLFHRKCLQESMEYMGKKKAA